MSDWNSGQYLKFKNERTQPATDLAMRVANIKAEAIADIGCGPGNSTGILKKVFPYADILGIDNSPNMIEKAKNEHPGLRFELCDALSLEGKYDLLFSNACLQWIPKHSELIPALMEKLNDGGVLAVQIPMNADEPLFRLIDNMAHDPKWGFQNLKPQSNGVLTPKEYYGILSGCSSAFDMWEIKYYHTLPDCKALVDWVKGTRLRPYLDFLGEEGDKFEAELVRRAEECYPVENNGSVVLGFKRFFFTAIK